MKQYKVLFIDLDGTLINTINGNTFPEGIWDMKFDFDVLRAIQTLAPEYVGIITNQGGIADGYVTEESFSAKINYISQVIKDYTGAVVHCSIAKDNNKENPLRKPNTGGCIKCLNEFRAYFQECIDESDCLMVGDASGKPGDFSNSDRLTASNFGIDYLDVEDFVKEVNEL